MKTINYFFSGSLLFLLDRVTKLWALQSYAHAVAFNRGVAWSFFHSESPIIFAGVTFMVLIIMALVAWHAYSRLHQQQVIWAEVLILAGAAGNLWDRFMYGGVIDFIALSYQDFYWPLFNVADCYIVIGLLFMLFEVLRS